jgi:ubiquinone biosynthesis protein Coq4
VLTGWKHGRETPQMLGLDWEREWNQPVDALRSKFGIRAYDSPYPADIIEQTRAAMAA